MLIVLKFGGTSLADTDRIRKAARRAAALRARGLQVVVVVSARGHTTDGLVADLSAICGDPCPRETDMCLATGEQLSAGLMALAAFLGASLCRIYTDVDGVYDRDPRKFPEAKKYSRIGYDDMLTLARQGAQVLHDRCVELAKEYAVPVQVLSSFRPGPGTLVTDVQDALLPVPVQDIPEG